MSVRRQVDALAAEIAELARAAGAEPDLCVLYQLNDGTPDLARFEQEYGATLKELEARGAVVVERTNFKSSNVELQLPPYSPMHQQVASSHRIWGDWTS